MATAALADLLTDFGARPRPAPEPVRPRVNIVPPPPPAPPPDIDAIVADAVNRAELALSLRLDAEHEAAMEALRATHGEELDALRGQLGAETGAKLVAALAGLEESASTAATSTAARILAQFVSDDIRDRAIAVLARTIKDAIGDADTIRIRVRGPQSLFVPLTMAMGEQARHLELTEMPAVDLTVSIDETLFETRISEWSAALAEIIGMGVE